MPCRAALFRPPPHFLWTASQGATCMSSVGNGRLHAAGLRQTHTCRGDAAPMVLWQWQWCGGCTAAHTSSTTKPKLRLLSQRCRNKQQQRGGLWSTTCGSSAAQPTHAAGCAGPKVLRSSSGVGNGRSQQLSSCKAATDSCCFARYVEPIMCGQKRKRLQAQVRCCASMGWAC